MTYRQDPPFSLQIEPTEGCNLRCGFCGIRGIREQGQPGALSGPFSFMTVETARAVARSMNGKRCAMPFREMAIRWDGSVALCCDDWRGPEDLRAIEEALSGPTLSPVVLRRWEKETLPGVPGPDR